MATHQGRRETARRHVPTHRAEEVMIHVSSATKSATFGAGDKLYVTEQTGAPQPKRVTELLPGDVVVGLGKITSVTRFTEREER